MNENHLLLPAQTGPYSIIVGRQVTRMRSSAAQKASPSLGWLPVDVIGCFYLEMEPDLRALEVND